MGRSEINEPAVEAGFRALQKAQSNKKLKLPRPSPTEKQEVKNN